MCLKICTFSIQMFIELIFSISLVSLNESNFRAIINNTKKLPVFVELWDPWCPNCKKFKPQWLEISKLNYLKDLVIIADIDCAAEKKICKKLVPGNSYPRFVWFDHDQTFPQIFSGEYSAERLIKFVAHQLNSTMKDIQSDNDLKPLLASLASTPLFLFNITKDDQQSISTAYKVNRFLRQLPVNFAIINDDHAHEPILSTITSDRRLIKFEDSFTFPKMKNFIYLHSLPTLSHYTELVADYGEIHRIPMAIFVFPTNNAEILKKVYNVTTKIETHIQTAQTSCTLNPTFCNYIGKTHDNEGFLVVMKKHERRWWILKTPFDPEDTTKWILRVLTYQEKGNGPGIGPLSNFLEMYFQNRATYGWKAGVMFLLPIVLFIGYVFGVSEYLYRKNEQQPQQKEKED